MQIETFNERFLRSSRGRIVSLLRRRPQTVDELATALRLSANAVRSHLATLERDGIVSQQGDRRGGGVGKPALLYQLQPGADPLLSRAYLPAFQAIVDALFDALPRDGAEGVLREAGRRLAHASGGRARGTLGDRARAAADVLTSLGGAIEVEARDDGFVIRGFDCPLSAVTPGRPEVCGAVETMVSEVTGATVRECCTRGEKPRCCFEVVEAA